MNTTTTSAPEVLPFEYVDLNEIDPTFKPIDQDVYNLQVIGAEMKTFTYKSDGKNHVAGDEGQYVKLTLAVTDHPRFAGRRLFESLFDGFRERRQLRKLMDATGVRQEPGTPLSAWLRTLAEIRPVFRAPVDQVPDVDRKGNARSIDPVTGQAAIVNKVNFEQVQPA